MAVGFFGADAVDHAEIGEGAGVRKDDGAEGGGGEDEELRETGAGGFGGAPGAKAGVEGLLAGSEGEVWWGCGTGLGGDGFGGEAGGRALRVGRWGGTTVLRGLTKFGSGEATRILRFRHGSVSGDCGGSLVLAA